MKNALLVLFLSLGIPVKGEYYDHEVTDTATTFQETLRSGDENHQYVSRKTYKVSVFEGEVVPVTVTFSMKLVSCSSGGFNVYLNNARCQPNGTKYELNLTSDAYILVETWAGNPDLIAPGREASTYYCEATYTLKATFPPRYTVHYLPGTGGVTGDEAKMKYPKGKTVTLGGEIYFRLGYRQRGWSSSDQGPKAYSLGTTVKMDENYELYPYWEAVPVYTIRYLPGAFATGSEKSAKKTQGLPITLLRTSPFERTGCVQTGWSRSDGGAKAYEMGAQYVEDANVTLYPYWANNEEPVTFKPGARGVGGTLVEYKTVNKTLGLHGPIYSRKGYQQCGWSRIDGGEREYKIYGGYDTQAPATFYPVWKPDPAAAMTYMVVDLSAGASATSYPVSYLADVPAGGWTDEYKTRKLVLRRIPVYDLSESHQAVVDSTGRTSYEPYYIGIFELTQKQYALIVGSTPRTDPVGDTQPVHDVSMRTIHSLYRPRTEFRAAFYDYAYVSDDSVFAKLRAKTGLSSFDLPSESMLSYAAAGGVEGHGCSVWYNGATGEFVDSIRDVAFFRDTNPNDLDCVAVGRFKPGNWGIYDAYGNADEWTTTYEIGGVTGNQRLQHVFGGWGKSDETDCRRVGKKDPATHTCGFRVCCKAPSVTPPPEAATYSIAYALGGGTHGATHPTSATYDSAFYVSAPTRSGYTFAGWTVTSGLNTSTAKWGTDSSPSTAIGSSSAKCVNGATGNVYFINLTATANGSVTLTANWTANATAIPLATALDTSLSFTTGGNASWFGQKDMTHDGSDAAQSGKIGDAQNSWMQTTVTGPGILSFWWAVSSESESYDYLEFSIDDVRQRKIGGTSASWTRCWYQIGAGNHSLKWNYRKDGSLSKGLDAGFVDQVVWTDNVVTEVRDLNIGFVSGGGLYAMKLKNGREVAFYDSWLANAGISTSGGITASLLNAVGRNGLPRYQSYLFGLEPESVIPAEEQLRPTIAFGADGTPIISCVPKMNNGFVTYTTLGKSSLGAAEWVEVTPANRASMKFFKVKVDLVE